MSEVGGSEPRHLELGQEAFNKTKARLEATHRVVGLLSAQAKVQKEKLLLEKLSQCVTLNKE